MWITISTKDIEMDAQIITYSFLWWWPLLNVCTIRFTRNLIGITKDTWFLTRGLQSVFCQRHISRNSYHTSTDWLKYWINFFTRVPVNFQHKINLAINNWLFPLNVSWIQCFYLVCQMVPLLCCLLFFVPKQIQAWKPNSK